MNIAVTSREELLCAAREMVGAKGISQLNLRGLAARCGVSVGTIYHYFPTKAELTVSLVEDFWKTAMHKAEFDTLPKDSFVLFFHAFFLRINTYFEAFESGWLHEVSQMSMREKAAGKEVEAACFLHIKEQMRLVLVKDPSISKAIWSEIVTPFAVTQFVFDSMMQLLRQRQRSDFLEEILKRVLYEANGLH